MKQQFFVGDVVEVFETDSDNWYRVGEKFVVTGWNDGTYASPKDPDHITVEGEDKYAWVEAKHVRLLSRACSVSSNEEQPESIPPSHVALDDNLVLLGSGPIEQQWTDKHYDNNYTLTQKDIERGFVKIDPYFVSKMWKIGSKDDSGALWHCFKTIARFGEKNSREREIKALYAQIKCLAEIEEVEL